MRVKRASGGGAEEPPPRLALVQALLSSRTLPARSAMEGKENAAVTSDHFLPLPQAGRGSPVPMALKASRKNSKLPLLGGVAGGVLPASSGGGLFDLAPI